ncbi:hypothetical protein LJK88_21640 [Paenibacillus sp. P26]|nr:hypothetical protein LJK88_21640 [Paenibacillus sp. P26]UUZ95813.1 hypothetical protein LJK87_16240 [Paenibacillus sp. P25]
MNKETVYVIKNGRVEVATGAQPKDALLFTSSGKSIAQIIREQKERIMRNGQFLRSRVEAATKRG